MITKDYQQVNPGDFVYEIQYAYINPEVSLAYSVRDRVKNLPEGTDVWRFPAGVLRECFKRNNPKQ